MARTPYILGAASGVFLVVWTINQIGEYISADVQRRLDSAYGRGFVEGRVSGTDEARDAGWLPRSEVVAVCNEPKIVFAQQGEFQAYIRRDQPSRKFVVPFSEDPVCQVKGSPKGGPKTSMPTVSADKTHVWVNSDSDEGEDYEVFCWGVRGTDI